MRKRLSEETLKYIIARVIDYANDAISEKEKNDFIQGKKMAYIEILGCIQNELIVNEVDLKEFGLDFDIVNTII